MNAHLEESVNMPVPRPGSIVVRVLAAAADSNTPGSMGGSEFAGIVENVGEGVTRYKQGDRILAIGFDSGATSAIKASLPKFALAEEDLSCHIPEAFTFEQACSIGLSLATAALALFQAPGLALSLDGKGNETVLISGGDTSTGAMATQLVKLAGYNPIVTCSPNHNALCESYGAAACFDHSSANCGADIRVYTDNHLKYVLDCVTSADNMKMCYEAIGSFGGSYIALDNIATTVKYTRRDVRADWLLTATISGNGVHKAGVYGRAPMPEHRRFGAQIFSMAEEWLQDGSIKSYAHESNTRVVPEILDETAKNLGALVLSY